jgi:hypothetical protein
MNGSPTFYATVATVLPLFTLTLTAQRRLGLRAGSESPELDVMIGISMLCAMAIGEFAAISALAGKPTRATLNASELGVGLAGLLLFADLIWAQVGAYLAYEPPRRRKYLVQVAAIAVVGFGALFLILTLVEDFF